MCFQINSQTFASWSPCSGHVNNFDFTKFQSDLFQLETHIWHLDIWTMHFTVCKIRWRSAFLNIYWKWWTQYMNLASGAPFWTSGAASLLSWHSATSYLTCKSYQFPSTTFTWVTRVSHILMEIDLDVVLAHHPQLLDQYYMSSLNTWLKLLSKSHLSIKPSMQHWKPIVVLTNLQKKSFKSWATCHILVLSFQMALLVAWSMSWHVCTAIYFSPIPEEFFFPFLGSRDKWFHPSNLNDQPLPLSFLQPLPLQRSTTSVSRYMKGSCLLG